jgi:iron complex outermembrane receptor protein
MKDIRIPSYVVFDASFRYDLAAAHAALRGWTLSASVRNLFDKRYIASCYGSAYSEWCWYGERRNAQATLSYSW